MEVCGQLSTASPRNRLVSLGAGFFSVNGAVAPFLYVLLADVPQGERVETALFGSGAITLAIKFFNTFFLQDSVRRILHIMDRLRDKRKSRLGNDR